MFGKGKLKAYTPIAGGIENSNYFVTLDSGAGDVEYVLTIIEQFDFEEAPFFNKVTSHLFHQGLPVAAPHSTLDGMSSTIFCGKPAFLQPRLEGSHLAKVDQDHCFQIGGFLGGAHQHVELHQTVWDAELAGPTQELRIHDHRSDISLTESCAVVFVDAGRLERLQGEEVDLTVFFEHVQHKSTYAGASSGW